MLFFGYEKDEENLTEKTTNNLENHQYFIENKKKIICILLILIFFFSWGYFYGIPYFFSLKKIEMDLWTQLKNYTDPETFNKIREHVQYIYENPYYRQKELNYLRFIQWTNLLRQSENSEELQKCIEALINQIQNEFKDVSKYTSYK